MLLKSPRSISPLLVLLLNNNLHVRRRCVLSATAHAVQQNIDRLFTLSYKGGYLLFGQFHE